MVISKEHKEFYPVDMASGWSVPPGYVDGFEHTILAGTLDEEAKTGNRTRLLRLKKQRTIPRLTIVLLLMVMQACSSDDDDDNSSSSTVMTVSQLSNSGRYAVGSMAHYVTDWTQNFNDWGKRYSLSQEYTDMVQLLDDINEPHTVITEIWYPSPAAADASVDDSLILPTSPLAAAEGRRATYLDFFGGSRALAELLLAQNADGGGPPGGEGDPGGAGGEGDTGGEGGTGGPPGGGGQETQPDTSTMPDWVRNSYVGAPLAEGQFPVIMLAHGGSGSPIDWDSLGEHLASHGYIVVAMTFSSDATVPIIFNNPDSVFAATASEEEMMSAYEVLFTGSDWYIPNFGNLLYGDPNAAQTALFGDPSTLTMVPNGAEMKTTMMQGFFQQRINDARAVIADLKILNIGESECEASFITKETPRDDICGFFAGSMDFDNLGFAGASLGSINTQVALGQIPEVKVGLAYNNGMPRSWEPPGTFNNDDDTSDMPAGVPKPMLMTYGSEDNFVYQIFHNLFITAWVAVGGNEDDIMKLPAERVEQTDEVPLPVARSCYERATGPKVLVRLENQGHQNWDDTLAASAARMLAVAGEDPRVYNEIALNADEMAPPGWELAEGSTNQYRNVPFAHRNFYYAAWFGLHLKNESGFANLILNDPFGDQTLTISEGVEE